MEYIRFQMKYTEVTNKERLEVIIHNIESTVNRTHTNELPVILNALARNTNLVTENDGLPYTLPFTLE